MILLIDNYDSFVHNLARYFRRMGCATHVIRNDALDIADLRRLQPQAIVISPGPGTPRSAGQSVEVVRTFSGIVPILGICLGHQVIAEAFGASTLPSPEPTHGQSSLIMHDGKMEYSGIPSPFQAARYHSLIVTTSSLPRSLEASAWTAERTLMGMRVAGQATFGWQFHPESILTPKGYDLLAGFLREASIPHDRIPIAESVRIDSSDLSLRRSSGIRPLIPVTF